MQGHGGNVRTISQLPPARGLQGAGALHLQKQQVSDKPYQGVGQGPILTNSNKQ